MNNEQVIIYRSRWEAERDQFFFENPEYILYVVGGCIAVAAMMILFYKVKGMMRR